MNLFKNNIANFSLIFVISCLSLNSYDHHFYNGLDGSYFWSFNYILNFLPQSLDKITFIYGPLASLCNPQPFGYMIIIGCLVQILMKFVLGRQFLKIAPFVNLDLTLTFVIFTLTCLVPFSIEACLNFIIILFLILFYLETQFLRVAIHKI